MVSNKDFSEKTELLSEKNSHSIKDPLRTQADMILDYLADMATVSMASLEDSCRPFFPKLGNAV